MLISKKKKCLVLRLRDPSLVTSVIPKAKVFQHKGKEFVAVKHGVDEVKVLRNIGINAPSPIKYHYPWPGRFKPFYAQRETADFLTSYRRAFCLNDLGCVDSETEYLSPTGWVKISEYTSGKVAQYHPDTNSMEFVEPIEYVKKPCDMMVRVKTKYGIDQLLSPEHRVLVHSRANPEKYEVLQAAELLRRHDVHRSGVKESRSLTRVAYSQMGIPASFHTEGGCGIPLSSPQLRVMVAVIADGYFPNGSNTCNIRIKKTRKKARLRDLLLKAGIEFVEKRRDYASAVGFSVFSFKAPWKVKHFDERFWDATRAQLEVLADEIPHWDANVPEKAERGVRFSSYVKASADFVQYVFSSLGYIARMLTTTRERRGTVEVEYGVGIRREKKTLLQIKGVRSNGEILESVWTEPSTDGFKYCFMVPSTFLIFRRNGCVFASGNTGKTLSTLWAYDYLRSIGVLKKVIVVSPLSTLERTWADEIWQNFPHLECAVAYGSAEKRIAMLNRRDVDIYLINHDGLKVAGVVESLKNRDDIDLVILDEISQAARNAGTDRYRALNTIINKQTPRWAWGLSGTPIPNKPTDAWAQCRLLVPDKVPAYFNRFRDMVERQVTQFLWVPRQNALDVVHDAMQPAIRFSRDDCVDLPPCQYVVRQVELTAPQKKAYKDMLNKLKAEIEDGEVTAVNEAVKAQKLIQIACGSLYDDQREVLTVDAKPRLSAVLEVVEECANKVIVFVPFVSVVESVSVFLKEAGHTVECIHGSVSKGERDRIFTAFQKSDTPKVLVAQPAAMSHGLTLTAASTIVWFAPITSADTFVQANGRITRPSQKNNQLIVMIEGTEIERRYYDRLSRKQKTQGTLLDMVKGGVIV